MTGVKRPEHSLAMSGRTLPETHYFFNETKSETHKANISKALTGIPKSEEHKKKMKTPKTRCCRLSDRKEIAVNHLNRNQS